MAAKPLVNVCAWCPDGRQRTLEEKAKGNDVTHGICPTCEQKWLKQAESKVA